jgi:hypothetical protein
MQDGATPHTVNKTIRELFGVFGELNGEDRIISKGLWPPIELLARVCGPQNLQIHPCDFCLWGKLKSVVYAKKPQYLESMKQIFVKQFTTFSNVNCSTIPEICLKEFRHISQQRAVILNIFYDDEYNITIFD